MNNYKNQKGSGLIEVVIAVSIISATMLGLLSAFNAYVRFGLSNNSRVQAAFIAEEGMEALRFMRDSGWSGYIDSLSEDSKYYFIYATSTGWSATDEKQLVNGKFERFFVLEDVYRHTSTKDIIASTSGEAVFDPNIKKATIKVDWETAFSPVLITTYLTNIFDE